MQNILLVVHVLLAIGLISFILMQHGKGADAGAAFGSGASATVFGSRGASSFLSRTTAILAIGFFVVSLALAILASRQGEPESVVQTTAPMEPESVPAVPAPVPDSDVPVINEIQQLPVEGSEATKETDVPEQDVPAPPATIPEESAQEKQSD